MKQPKKLTREQKIILSSQGYHSENWMLEEETEFYLKIVNKETGTRRRVDRYTIPKKGRK